MSPQELFAEELRRLRRAAGDPSYAKLAKLSGVPRSTIWGLLNGKFAKAPDWFVVEQTVRAIAGSVAQKSGDLVARADPALWKRRHGELERALDAVASIKKAQSRLGQPEDSDYWHHVTQIAPGELVRRETELAALAEFCTADKVAGSYWWWRAKAWSGKSALMSWFVLHPPAGVRVVSFFITARMQGHNDRSGFLDNVMEQLEKLLRVERPHLTSTTKETYLLRLLAKAAKACEDQGERLILLVDGLDEDLGVTTDPDARSIAALLPSRPPSGMRVVVASRPNPPVPADVPASHPLHDNEVTRALSQSGQARAIQRELERELSRLSQGEPHERDLLGLLTAAGSGLTAGDLAELTDLTPHEIERQLRASTGRSFVLRDEVYILGHEDLRATALAIHSARTLEHYRNRLHRWIDRHRVQGWPDEPSPFLLQGCVAMFVEAQDLARLVSLTTDPARHAWLLAHTGDDAHALRDVHTAMALCVDHEPGNLAAIGRLAFFRDELATHTERPLPGLLPLLVSLGQVDRAERLAEVAKRGPWQSDELIAPLAESGDIDRALARLPAGLSQWDHSYPAWTMAVITAMAVAGRDTEAQELTDRTSWPWGTFALARGYVKACRHDQALPLLDRLVAISDARGGSLTIQIAKLLARLGDVGRAEILAEHARTDVFSARLWAAVAADMMPTDRAHAEPMLRKAETILATAPQSDDSDRAVTDVCLARIALGDYESAVQCIQVVSNYSLRELVYIRLAMHLATSGRHEEAVSVARSFDGPHSVVGALVALTRCMDPVNDNHVIQQLIAEAEVVATTYEDDTSPRNAVISSRATTLLNGARVLITAEPFGVATAMPSEHAFQQARAWTEQAEQISRAKDNLHTRAYALADLAGAMVSATSERGLTRYVISMAQRFLERLEPRYGGGTLSRLALAAADFGDHETAVALAEAAMPSIADKIYSLSNCMKVFLATDELGKAQALAESLTGRRALHYLTLIPYVKAWLSAGNSPDVVTDFISVREAASILAETGRIDDGEALAQSRSAEARLGARLSMARALADLGDREAVARVLALVDKENNEEEIAAQDLEAVLDGMVAYAVAGCADTAERLLQAAFVICRDKDSSWSSDAHVSLAYAMCTLPKSGHGAIIRYLPALVTKIRSLSAEQQFGQADNLTRLASVLSKGGHTLLATQVAEDAKAAVRKEGSDRAWDLVHLSSALGSTPDHDKLACEFLAEAWKTGPWPIPLQAVAGRQPEVVETLARLVISQWGDQPEG